MDPSWKETVVVLIPKVTCSDHPSKFRPISLCQTIYKVVAKILVNRLKGVLPLIISEEQAAFVPGRSITTHCLLGQELIHKFKVSKAARGFFSLKVDMEQAYDKMSWRTLEIVLGRLGIPPRFGAWVLSCVMGPKFFILTNGKFSNVINAECGFRQGCPLSPYLFILCSELLSAHFKHNFGEMGVPISLGGPPVSHLLYADDILFFAGASLVNARKVTSILTDYCSWTGQQVNRTKSAVLFSKRTPSTMKARLTKLLGCCRVDEFEYLGIKFAMRRLTRLDFSPLVQRARAHTLGWGSDISQWLVR
ncbi:putative mitochondrial protein [Dendrobium catenatum]|uniref:Putative mitochondrial protein n=1 Tax=Dendrobium catenatum TaxID=906689 RepID=A0A2I0VVR8_9ASPA|nr:putative mitochondrial protein [Dendrobium catenatum]